ncbi:MAG TPA: BatA domain-containing protein [Pirellulales bacterium]|nr:BatA domain-containing protein [Pirellulales bacterium]
MFNFINPNLALWGSLLVALPVLIHLINLLRHRRVPWAAMEFLLESQRRNSTWIRLKQLLLLLLRMAAVAGVVLLVAQPLGCNELGRLLGGQKSQHIVLLDDSFSMSDRWSNTSAFDEAKAVVARIGEELSRQPLGQSFTLLRFSRAGRSSDAAPADFLQEKVTTDFGQRLQDALRSMRPSQQAMGPNAAVRAVESWSERHADEERVVYLVSDFRANDWDEPDDLAKTLARLDRSGVQLRLIDCVDAARGNLSIAGLEPLRGTRAAGVPFYMAATVTNYGSEPAEGVTVLLQEDGQARPAVSIDRIAPGQRETRRFSVFFPTAGEHTIAASLASDSVAADNLRFAVVDLPPSVPVLLVDGSADTAGARYLAAALAPGGAVKTGIDPQIEPPSYLNRKPLEKFQAVYLLDVGHLDAPAVEALEAYVRQGGGLGVFLGDACRAGFYNEALYRDGEGVIPMPLGAKTQLLVDRLEKGADFEITDHPIFRVFAGERNSYLTAVMIDWYMAVPKTWSPPADSSTRVLARLRNGAPLAVERKFGEGRVVAFTTTASPTWNNWGRNPSFVVAMLEMQSYLASPATTDVQRLVGTPIELELDPGRYQSEVRLLVPPDEVEKNVAGKASADGGLVAASAVPDDDGAELRASFTETPTSGVYQVELTTVEGTPEVRRLAVNVEAAEGNLATVAGDELASKLEGVHFEYSAARQFQMATHELGGANLSPWIIYCLVGLLVGEQLLAYSAGYHTKGSPEGSGFRVQGSVFS